MTNTMMKRIEKLEQKNNPAGDDLPIIVVRWVGKEKEEVIRLKCNDWQIDREPGESEDDFLERGRVAARNELPDPSPSGYVLMSEMGVPL